MVSERQRSVKPGNKKGRPARWQNGPKSTEALAPGSRSSRGTGHNSGAAGSDRGIVGGTQAIKTAVGLANLGAKAAAHEILQLLIGAQAQHFFATAHRIFQLEIVIHQSKQSVTFISLWL